MQATLADLTSPAAVIKAIEECEKLGRDNFLKKYGYKYSRLYLLLYNDQYYDSKAIAGVAIGKQHGTPLRAKDFSGGMATVVPVLRKLGFHVIEPQHPAIVLTHGTTYMRKDLVERFGGQLQAGIWTPRDYPAVFIFSGDSGKAYGYSDDWTSEGLFKYTGEGQDGDMTFTGGNRAIRDHKKNGKELLLFEDLGKGKGVRYQGCFDCASWEESRGKDKSGNERKVIIFHLLPLNTGAPTSETLTHVTQPKVKPERSLEELRQAAYAVVQPEKFNKGISEAKRSWYERSEKVKDYVLARARGICEACDTPAPFKKKDGSPYLEPHHTTRLSDDGPDHPEWVGAICPNCHRRIHSGADGTDWNKALQKKLKAKETLLATP